MPLLASNRPRNSPHGLHASPPPAEQNIVPFDYGARFELTGEPGRIVQDVIRISPDGYFVAIAIGYGIDQDAFAALWPEFDDAPSSPQKPSNLALDVFPATALVQGLRVNPDLAELIFTDLEPGSSSSIAWADQEIPVKHFLGKSDEIPSVFQRRQSSAPPAFLLNLIDSTSGREFQDQPTYNLAALGSPDGNRPFRWLAQPMTFQPRSTVRLQVTERSGDTPATLDIVLFGYQVIGTTLCAEELAAIVANLPSPHSTGSAHPAQSLIPFDYVTSLALTGLPDTRVETETTVNVEGGFVATSVGYGLLPAETGVTLDTADLRGSEVDLGSLTLDRFPASALFDGIRLKPDMVRLAFRDNGLLADTFPIAWLPNLFERLNGPESVRFRYAIYDGGRGRDLQNQELYNIAGLGSATGRRPFKKLARPWVLWPRSTIRVRVEERFGRGTVYFTFQGYKLLGQAGGAA